MAADFVPKAKRDRFNILADLAETKIEYPFLSLNRMAPYIDRNLRTAKALIKSMSESVRALQNDPPNARIAVRSALKTDDTRNHRVRFDPQPPGPRSRAVSHPRWHQDRARRAGQRGQGKNFKYEDFIDMRALPEREKQGTLKS